MLERLAPYADRNVQNARGAAGYGSAAYHVAVLEALLGLDAAPAASRRPCRRNTELGSRAVGREDAARPYAAYTSAPRSAGSTSEP